jgi:hypothetical protein
MKPKQTTSSRRGFLQSFFSDLVPSKSRLSPEDVLQSKKAGITALKYAKDQARLTQIGVELPQPLPDGLFSVNVFGLNITGVKINLTLEVNPDSEDIVVSEVFREDISTEDTDL